MKQLDLTAGQQAAADAMDAVESAATQEIKDALMAAIHVAAHMHDVFSSDQVWVEFALMFPTLTVQEPRLLGPLMRRSESLGICKSTGRTRRSERPQRHTGSVTVYRSLVYAGSYVGVPKEIDDLAAANARIADLEQEVAQLAQLYRARCQRT